MSLVSGQFRIMDVQRKRRRARTVPAPFRSMKGLTVVKLILSSLQRTQGLVTELAACCPGAFTGGPHLTPLGSSVPASIAICRCSRMTVVCGPSVSTCRGDLLLRWL
jgi:hypothetical protein